MKLAVIGYGYWGPNIVRNIVEGGDASLKAVVDKNEKRLELVKTRYPFVVVSCDPQSVMNDPEIDAVIVVTPVDTHFPIVKSALLSGKHVLVEKPICASSAQAKELEAIANEQKKVLMVDHTYVYHPAVEKMKQAIEQGRLGKILYVESTRVSLGSLEQTAYVRDVDVTWDLAIHDLSILDYIFRVEPECVTARGVRHSGGNLFDVAYITLQYPGKVIANINVNWLSPIKIRRMIIAGEKQAILFDDNETIEKLKVFDRETSISQINPNALRIGFAAGDIHIPKLEPIEPLRVSIQHFLTCVRYGTVPRSDSAAGIRVVRVLERISQSLRSEGERA